MRMAVPVAVIMAEPIPWAARPRITSIPDEAAAMKTEDSVKTIMPAMKKRLRPKRSPSLPKGTTKEADTKRKAILIQPSITAPNPRVFPIWGRATFTDAPMKGDKKEVRQAAVKALRSRERRARSDRSDGFIQNTGQAHPFFASCRYVIHPLSRQH